MMDFSEFFIIGADFKDLQGGDMNHRQLMADIVVVDRTDCDGHNPILYSLKSEAAEEVESQPRFRKEMFHDTDHPFVYVGEIISIDRTNRRIYLTNDNVLAYKYLIVVSGIKDPQVTKERGDQFSSALETLFHALKIRRKGVSFPQTPRKENGKQLSFSVHGPRGDKVDVEELVKSAISLDTQPSAGYAVADKRLFEVQV